MTAFPGLYDDLPRQPVCADCTDDCPVGCAVGRPEDYDGACLVQGCRCHGLTVDGGLCEACYIHSK